MITSFIEMLQLPNFGHMTISTIQFVLHDKFLLVTLWTEIMTSKYFFQNTFILRRPKVANFADIIKIATTLIKATLKDSNKVNPLTTIGSLLVLLCTYTVLNKFVDNFFVHF